MALGRLFAWKVDHGETVPGPSAGFRPSAGDGLALGLVAFLALVPEVPYVLLRHGLLVPLTLIVIADIARGRGLLGRLLAWRGFGRLSEASFSLFALQMPAGVWFCVATLRTPHGTNAHLLAMIAWTLGLAVVWAEAVQRPLVEQSRGTTPPRSDGRVLPTPRAPRAVDTGAPASPTCRG
jgi:peptidoglycan/LPS O-acetylase OafA/YrhL